MTKATPHSLFLRPPGVRSEKDFLSRCISCGQCAAVCKYNSIDMTADYFLGPVTPKISPRTTPCFLCMKCSDICPTGALRTIKMDETNMGTASIDMEICHSYQEQNSVLCWTCFERCPLKGTSIILAHGYIPEITKDCVGCGVCEYVCPTHAINTTPTRKINTARKNRVKS